MWAFGTSAHGLALDAAYLWTLTPREFWALRQVWREGIERQSYSFAALQATLYNAHFETDGLPYTPEDMMGTGNRALRKRDMMRDQIESRAFNQKLATVTTTEDLPDWSTRANAWKETVN